MVCDNIWYRILNLLDLHAPLAPLTEWKSYSEILNENVKTPNGYWLRPTMARIEVAAIMVEMVSMVQVFMQEWLVMVVLCVI